MATLEDRSLVELNKGSGGERERGCWLLAMNTFLVTDAGLLVSCHV